MKLLNKIFHLSEKKATLKNEIIGGIITFVSMCYILPLNSSILHDMGMNQAGVFAMTAIVGCVVTFIMAFFANYPVVLSAGMGLNAYITYTIALGAGYSWQQAMILLTVAGVIFFVISLTPIRKIIIESIPEDLKHIISAALGAFICFVGLKNSGVIVSSSSTFVELGSFSDPGLLISLICIVLCFGLMFCKNRIVSSLAIPISVLAAAIIGATVSTILISNGTMTNDASGWQYVIGGNTISSSLPIVPWLDNVSWGLNGVEDVVFYGLISKSVPYTGTDFGSDLVKVFTNPVSYVAIFSLMFVNLFDTTATLLAIDGDTHLFKGQSDKKFQRVLLADATGAAVCAPFGTSTVTAFVESNIGVSLGARTGLAAFVSGLLFLLSAFIYPVFSIFTAGSVTSPALVCVGALIFVNNFKEINLKDKIIGFTGFVVVIFAILTYSIASGIGIGLFCYITMMLFSRRAKEIKLPIYLIAALFIISFTLSTILPFISKVS